METFEDLKKRDELREKDGFSKKLKNAKVVGRGGKIKIVPTVVEEKLVHDSFNPMMSGGAGGQGEGEEGDVIGESPIHEQGPGEGEDVQPGGEGGGEHGIDADPYELGKELIEKFDLPNLKDKGKKVPTDKYEHDLTDIHKGSGQFLDKNRTFKSLVRTNIVLGRLDRDDPDTTRLIGSQRDKVYRVLSPEKVWESMAQVFFMRDYSGSMQGDRTTTIVAQHVMIYSWLMAQYEKLVIPRFIVHDTEAEEVPDFYQYYRAQVAGGTKIFSAFKLVNEIVEKEGLARDFNIFIFYGTDGDDWDTDGKQAVPEIEKALGYANRIGVCIVKSKWNDGKEETEFERYINASGVKGHKDLFRMHVMPASGLEEDPNVKAIKELLGQD